MFPSFSSLSDRSRKQQKLIDRLSLDSQLEKTNEKAYGQAFINPETFSLDPFKPHTSVGTQTESSTSTTTSSSDPRATPPSRERDEYALMAAEDVRSQFLRYETKLEQMYDQAALAINQTMMAYEHLSNQHMLSQRENDMLRKDFEDGRQLYLRLQREKERIENSNDDPTRKLNELKDDYWRVLHYTIASLQNTSMRASKIVLTWNS
ncbi:hypothetical protein Plhal710r2_c041g0142101 [Plasmopara halstedii]